MYPAQPYPQPVPQHPAPSSAPGPYGPGAAPPLPPQGPAAPGWGAPPAAPSHGEPTGPKRRVGLMIGLVGGGVTIVLALVVAVIVVVTQPDSHALSTPASAAGLQRDPSAEKLINTTNLKRDFRQHASGQVTKVVSAVYSDATQSDQVLFVGAEASSLNSDSIISDFTSSAQNTQDVGNSGGLTGKAVCGELSGGSTGTAIACVWADNDTFGQFLMLTDGHAVSELASIMQRMRPALEKKK